METMYLVESEKTKGDFVKHSKPFHFYQPQQTHLCLKCLGWLCLIVRSYVDIQLIMT
jgi:hypothetical protein